MNISNILYRILGGLFLLSIVSGMIGFGYTHNRVSAKNPYLAGLKKLKFFDSRDYSSQMSRERQRDVMRSRERLADDQRSMDDRLQDQRLALAVQKEQKPQPVLPAAIAPEDRNKEVREQLTELRYRNRDAQERYRQLIDAQRFKDRKSVV